MYVRTYVPEIVHTEKRAYVHCCTCVSLGTSQKTPRDKCVRRAPSDSGGAMITSSAPINGVLAPRNNLRAQTKWFFVKHAKRMLVSNGGKRSSLSERRLLKLKNSARSESCSRRQNHTVCNYEPQSRTYVRTMSHKH